MRTFRILLALLAFPVAVFAQIKSGPMVGYSEMKEALLWIQTQKEAAVHFVYWEQSSPTAKHQTSPISTKKESAYIAKAVADELEPGKKYSYEVYINNKKQSFSYPLTFQTQTLWQYRTEPPAFKMAIGSCFYVNEEATDRPGKPYGSEYEIVKSIYDKKPDMMLWIGDNTYTRETDYGSKTGLMHRYSHTRSLPELQPLLASTHHFATWDDHDYGPNDGDRSYILKNDALGVFKNFWGNQAYTFPNDGVTSTFTWSDCQFFMMDDRWWRAPNDRTTGNRDYWGQQQLQWLIDALRDSKAPFKFVVNGGQVINPAKLFENMSNYEDEWKQMIDLITKEKIPGVVFVSGDRHFSSLQKMDRAGTYPLYDLTVSSLTAGSGGPVKDEASSPIVEGTLIEKRHNFAILEITGTRKERVMNINMYDKDGQLIWKKEIKASELK